MINNIAARHNMVVVSYVSVLLFYVLYIDLANSALSFTVLDMKLVVMLWPVMSLSPRIK